MKWSPTEPWLLVGDCCGNVSIWNVEKDVLKTRLAGQLAEMRLQWSPDGWTVTSEGIHPDMGLRVWNVETGKKLHYDMNRERTDIFTIDGFIRGKKYGRLGEIVQQKQGPSYHLSEFSNVLAWSPDGKYLISGDSDYAIRTTRFGFIERLTENCYTHWKIYFTNWNLTGDVFGELIVER